MYLKTGLTILLLMYVFGDEVYEGDEGWEGEETDDYSNGFGEQYKWSPDLESALREGRETGKPVVVIIHKSWCHRCEKLKEDFSKNKALLEISSHFVLVNCLDDDEPSDKSYAPDGYYVPRIIFKWGSGESINCTNRWGLKRYEQYFYNSKHIVKCLKEIAASVQEAKNATNNNTNCG